ncbi:hypothetical protein ES705_26904 [subsurface metagenome]
MPSAMLTSPIRTTQRLNQAACYQIVAGDAADGGGASGPPQSQNRTLVHNSYPC